MQSVKGHAAWDDCYISEVIVHTDDTRIKNLVTLAPNGAGDTNDWTGTQTAIDDTIQDDADYISIDAPGDALFSLSDLPDPAEVVTDLKIAATIQKTPGASVGTAMLGFKRSGGSIDVDAGHTASEGVITYEERYMTQVDGTALSYALVNDLQIALRSDT
jgi:hypothetical protein